MWNRPSFLKARFFWTVKNFTGIHNEVLGDCEIYVRIPQEKPKEIG